MWTIDAIQFNEEDMLFNILGNVIVFEDNGTCKLPKTRIHSEIQTSSQTGQWNIVQGENSTLLIINSANAIFNGEHQLRFEKDEENRMLLMVIYSKTLRLEARKALVDYDANQTLINELVDKTNE